MLKKMCPGLYPRLVRKLEGIYSTKVQGKKKICINQSHWMFLPCGLSLKSSPWSICWCWVKPLLVQAGCRMLWAELPVPAESLKTGPATLELLGTHWIRKHADIHSGFSTLNCDLHLKVLSPALSEGWQQQPRRCRWETASSPPTWKVRH